MQEVNVSRCYITEIELWSRVSAINLSVLNQSIVELTELTAQNILGVMWNNLQWHKIKVISNINRGVILEELFIHQYEPRCREP